MDTPKQTSFRTPAQSEKPEIEVPEDLQGKERALFRLREKAKNNPLPYGSGNQ